MENQDRENQRSQNEDQDLGQTPQNMEANKFDKEVLEKDDEDIA